MARQIEAFKERIEIEVANAKANAALQQTVKHVENLTGGFKGMLGAFSREAEDSIKKLEGLTGSFGKLSSVLNGLGGGSITSGPLGIVAGGLGAIGTAAAAAAVGLFTLAEKSSEIGKSILEIHEKANVSTQSISAFRVAAEQVGTPFELVGNKLAGFSVAMGKAQLGNKAMIQVFKDMGVSLHQGVEPALTQFIERFDRMGPSAKRSALEAQLFRDRTGEMIPVLEQLGGSLEEAKKRAEELGLSFSEKDAKAAKDFDDTLKLLGLQLKGVAEDFSKEYMPEILDSMKGLSKSFKDNQGVIKEWGQSFADVMRGAKSVAQSELGQIALEVDKFALKWLTLPGLIATGFGALGKAERPPAVLKTETRAESFKNISDRFVKGPDITPPDNADVKEKKARAKKLPYDGETPAEFHAAMGKFIAALNAMGETTTLISGGRTTAQQKSIWDRRDPKTGLFHGNPVAPPGTSMHERNLAADLSFRGPMSQESIGKLAESMGITWGGRFSKPDPGHFQAGKGLGSGASAIQKEIDKLTKTYDDYLLRLDKEAAELKLSDAAYAQHRGIFKEEQVALDLTGDAYKNLSKSQKDAIVAKAKEVGETERASAAARTFAEFIANQKKELDQLSGAQRTASSDVDDFQAASIKAGAAIDAETLALMRQNAVLIDSSNKWQGFRDSVLAAAAAMKGGGWGQKTETPDKFSQAIQGAADAAFPKGWNQKTAATIDPMKAAFADLKKTGMDAFGSLAQGIGSMVENLVLMGTAGPDAMRKLTASVLAGVAAQAAVKAIFSLAEGFADLFWNPAKASADFTAAALYGSVAGVAGGLGRVAAGNKFQNTGTAAAAAPGRAFGGPVSAGRSYIVGERRPELFVPNQDGYIHPNAVAAMSGGGGLHPAVLGMLTEFREAVLGLSAEVARLKSFSPDHVVMKGASGLLRAMDSNAGMVEKMGRRLNFK